MSNATNSLDRERVLDVGHYFFKKTFPDIPVAKIQARPRIHGWDIVVEDTQGCFYEFSVANEMVQTVEIEGALI